ncbi:methyl-accepting chemotaxis protein [Vibrio sp. RC27]
MKFSHKIVAASSVLLFTTVALLSFQQQYTVKNEIESMVNSNVEEMVVGISRTMTASIDSKKSLAQSVADTLALAPNDREYVSNILETPQIKSSFLGAGLGYQSDGRVVENFDNWTPGDDYDPRQRPWYIDAKQKGSIMLTQPYMDAASNQMITSIGVPVSDKGSFTGVMFFDMDLSSLSELVNSTTMFDSSYLFIVTKNGITIAHPDQEKNGQELSSYLPQLQIKEGMQTVEVDGETYLVDITLASSEGWYVAAVVNESVAFSTLDALKTSSIIYTLVGFVLSVIALMFLLNVLMKPLGALNRAIKDVASGEGDLTKRLDTNTDQEFSELAQAFNEFTQSLQGRIRQSKEISGELHIGADTILDSSETSAKAVDSQMYELEQLATAMNEMSVTASEVAGHAQQAADAAKLADDATIEGEKMVETTTNSISTLSERIEQAVQQVKGLESATTDIETVLKVINDIADQTNLLALNAAIEAARAGESGRGFAVVADEVRTLASRTQESTTEIKTMIEQLQQGSSAVSLAMLDSQTTVSEAVEHSAEADRALVSIRESISQISDMNIQIASAAEEQNAVAEEINANTVKIKDIGTQVSVQANDVAQAIQSQVNQVREQEKLLNTFVV